MSFDPTGAVPVDGPGDNFDPTGATPVESATPHPVPSFVQDAHAGLTHGAAAVDPTHSLDRMLYPEVDFDTGLPHLDRVHLAQADNFQEKRNYLEQVYGKSNVEVDTDPFGAPMLVVNQNGKKVAAEGGNGFATFGANVLGTAPEWVLGAVGGAIGTAAEPGLGTLAGAGLGAGVGKEIEQLQKVGEGWYAQSARENTLNAFKAVEEGATGEAGGQLASKAASRFLRGKLPSIVSGSTPESRQLTDRLLDQGARPPISQAGPDMKSLQWKQRFAEQTVGPNKAASEANTAFLRRRVRDLLGDSGLSDEQVDAIAKQLEEGDSAVPTKEVGQHVKDRVQAHRDMLESSTRNTLSDVNDTLKDTMKHLDGLIGRYRTGDLGVDVAGAIQAARADFGKAMSKGYAKVDQLAGNQKLVDTDIVAREATSMGRRLPRTGTDPLVRETSGLAPKPGEALTQDDVALYQSLGLQPPPPSGAVTFSDAQGMRSALRAKADELSLTRDPKAGMAARLADMWDYAIQAAGKKPEAAPAVRMLNAVDKAYAQGIKRFKDATVQRLVNDLKAGLPPDPEKVAGAIVQPGQSARVREIRKLVGEEMWGRVAGADYSRMMQAATDETGQVSGLSLLSEIQNRGKLMTEVYGAKQAGEIEELARSLAARDGHLDPEMLRAGNLRKTITLYRQAEEQENRFMRESAIAQLANPRRNPEQAYRWLVKPENTHALDQAVQLFGENSQQVQGLRQAALQELLSQTKFAAADGRPAEALADALKKYTPEQQKLLFPNDMDRDLHLLAREVQALVPTQSAGNVGIAAGATNALPLWVRAPANIYFGLFNTLLSQPGVIRYLATGLRSESGPARIAARKMVESLARYGAISPSVGSNAGAPNGTDSTQPGGGGGAQVVSATP